MLDFGIAKVKDAWGDSASVTATGAMIGTPAFMPPEQVLAASKHDAIETKVEQYQDHEVNKVARYTSSKAPFSVIEDKNPKGAEWLNRLVRFG